MFSFLLSSILFMTPLSDQAPNRTENLKRKIQNEFAKNKGTFALAYKNLSNNEEILINEKESFHAASTMKTPILIEAYKQAKENKFSINDSLIVKNEFKSIVDGSSYSLNPQDDSELELYQKLGQKIKIYDLLYLMIIKSSNLATNIIIDLIGAENAQKTMKEIGANDMKILRGVEDSKAFRKGLNNTSTAYDQMIIFSKMAKGELVNKSASDEMIKILLDQEFRDKIPAKLPKEVKVAHKTGWITGVNHDTGIVFLPDGRKYVLVFHAKNLENDKSAVKSMAKISKMIYDHVVGQY